MFVNYLFNEERIFYAANLLITLFMFLVFIIKSHRNLLKASQAIKAFQ